MRNLFIIIMLLLPGILNSNALNEKSNVTCIIEVLPLVVTDVIQCDLEFGLGNNKQMISFIKYLKTQSETLTNENSKTDVYFVVQTLYNRMRHKKCSWKEYWDNPRLNQSQSIRRLKSGELKQYFNWNSKHDQELYDIVYACNTGDIEDKYKLPRNILFFESFKIAPDKGAHVLRNFYIKKRHRFYKHDEIKIT